MVLAPGDQWLSGLTLFLQWHTILIKISHKADLQSLEDVVDKDKTISRIITACYGISTTVRHYCREFLLYCRGPISSHHHPQNDSSQANTVYAVWNDDYQELNY